MPDPESDHKTATEARAGATPHMARYVLVFGLIGVVVLFALLLFVWS